MEGRGGKTVRGETGQKTHREEIEGSGREEIREESIEDNDGTIRKERRKRERNLRMMGMIVDEEKKKEERKEEKKEEDESRRDSIESLEISEEAGEELQDDSSPLPVTSSRPRAAGLRRPMRTMDGERWEGREGKGEGKIWPFVILAVK